MLHFDAHIPDIPSPGCLSCAFHDVAERAFVEKPQNPPSLGPSLHIYAASPATPRSQICCPENLQCSTGAEATSIVSLTVNLQPVIFRVCSPNLHHACASSQSLLSPPTHFNLQAVCPISIGRPVFFKLGLPSQSRGALMRVAIVLDSDQVLS